MSEVLRCSPSIHNGGDAGGIHPIEPKTQAHGLGQFSLEFMQPRCRGAHRSERDVPLLKINHHCYVVALQPCRDDRLLPIVVGDQLAAATVREAPGVRVVSEGAPGISLVFDAPEGDSDVPVSLNFHLPCVGAGAKAVGGEDLRGFNEAIRSAGIPDLGSHFLCYAEVIGDLHINIGGVQVKQKNLWRWISRAFYDRRYNINLE